VEVPPGEPLALELGDFVGAVSGATAPRVDGAEGRRALALAVRVAAAMRSDPGSSAEPA
jgi:predicted dehydrogenase